MPSRPFCGTLSGWDRSCGSLLGTGGAIAAGIGARKVLNTGWEKATGNPPPVNPASPNVQVLEAVAWAAVSGAIIQARPHGLDAQGRRVLPALQRAPAP
ncbi:hypothetical protein GCM10025868_25140 [Angustibacter aerolatus]|uniref:DUF4235 domain-containing protein n=1 Tax=Angustibacter aerolatus TaxID=1162965 RepID=A0ABQ6JIT7_9ACTN|nr:DUF4235 domain-containing protein [Angustibacter aerolatus]GMA87264.1 hypothetical protein GCM10025868_25140 [Angustibacter aerolatus]